MRADGTLKRRISRTFLLQAAAISIAAIISVLLAAAVIKHVLVTEALRMEADYFWTRHAADPAFALPDTRNLSAYLTPSGSAAGLPDGLAVMQDGFHEIDSDGGFTTLLVTSRDAQQLYLVFDGERVDELAAYFGLVPLVVVLLVLYLSVWLAFRASHRAISPVTWLAREVNRLQPDAPHPERFAVDQLPSDADEEVRVLATALSGLATRLDAFAERERTFTRDASHELRSPLTVIKIAADVLTERDDLPGVVRESVQRIRRSCDDMQRLVEAFLLLSRETETGLPNDTVCINDVVDDEFDRLDVIARAKAIDMRVTAAGRLLVEGPQQVVASVIGNLLRNAVEYTDEGQVEVQIGPGEVVIEDSGIGMQASDLDDAFKRYARADSNRRGGHGVGLTIVKRFADRFGWVVSIESEVGRGTRVRVQFPHARSVPAGTAPTQAAPDRPG